MGRGDGSTAAPGEKRRFRPGPRSLWRHPNFLRLWTAETISQLGTQVTLLGLPLIAILLLKANALEVGLLGTAEFLPFILFGLPAGAWVDRLRRRPILIIGDLGRALSLGSIPLVYELFIEPLSDAQRDTFCREAGWLAQALGVPDGMAPLSWDALRRDLARTYASGHIVVGPTARDLAAAVLNPPLAALVAPATYLNRLLTIGLLPPEIRAQYGFRWNARRERALQAAIRLVRVARRAMPDTLALWPEARSRRK